MLCRVRCIYSNLTSQQCLLVSCARGTSRFFTDTGHVAMQHHVVDCLLLAERLAISCTYTESTGLLVRQVHLLPLSPGWRLSAHWLVLLQGAPVVSRHTRAAGSTPGMFALDLQYPPQQSMSRMQAAASGSTCTAHDAACRVWNPRPGVEPDAATVAGFALVCICARCPLQQGRRLATALCACLLAAVAATGLQVQACGALVQCCDFLGTLSAAGTACGPRRTMGWAWGPAPAPGQPPTPD